MGPQWSDLRSKKKSRDGSSQTNNISPIHQRRMNQGQRENTPSIVPSGIDEHFANSQTTGYPIPRGKFVPLEPRKESLVQNRTGPTQKRQFQRSDSNPLDGEDYVTIPLPRANLGVKRSCPQPTAGKRAELANVWRGLKSRKTGVRDPNSSYPVDARKPKNPEVGLTNSETAKGELTNRDTSRRLTEWVASQAQREEGGSGRIPAQPRDAGVEAESNVPPQQIKGDRRAIRRRPLFSGPKVWASDNELALTDCSSKFGDEENWHDVGEQWYDEDED
ncbi:hypothetical protein AJ79_02547 [Helicocarpus griseus UAMH5409]|uniref:Uncharacterized protein n=1 Tax=Helicocarpus griseus UAMH5409 TaxID=1447875 RepID=A0A2B7Y2U7_9EURO|nr:hypothetical protein AJ79_02547 [Helicocarpus griseus UAMH5409]